MWLRSLFGKKNLKKKPSGPLRVPQIELHKDQIDYTRIKKSKPQIIYKAPNIRQGLEILDNSSNSY